MSDESLIRWCRWLLVVGVVVWATGAALVACGGSGGPPSPVQSTREKTPGRVSPAPFPSPARYGYPKHPDLKRFQELAELLWTNCDVFGALTIEGNTARVDIRASCPKAFVGGGSGPTR